MAEENHEDLILLLKLDFLEKKIRVRKLFRYKVNFHYAFLFNIRIPLYISLEFEFKMRLHSVVLVLCVI